MNLKNVLKIYALERHLNPDDIALLNTLRSMNDTERESLVVALQPEKVTTRKPSTERKIEHCVACDYTKRAAVHKDSSLKDYHEFVSAKEEKEEKKSKRATLLAERIKGATAPKSSLPCAHILPDDNHCMEPEENIIHDLSSGYATAHEFVLPARQRSSTNGGVTNSTASSATEPEGVSNAVHAGG